MDIRMEIKCPDCGRLVQRLLRDCLPIDDKYPAQQVTQTECSVCKYLMVMCWQNLMVMCWQNGRVLEVDASGRQGYSGTATIAKPATEIALLPMLSPIASALMLEAFQRSHSLSKAN